MPDTDITPIHALRGLAVIAESPTGEHAGVAEALGLPAAPTPSEYADVLLFQLYPYASVHLGPEGMMGGVARDRVAGFWRALGMTPPPEPDHLAAILGLYAGLVERVDQADDAEARLFARAARTLLDEHLAPWVFAWLERVEELGTETFRTWAGLLTAVLREEVTRSGEGDPRARTHRELLHLRDAPGLPDPRDGGGDAFAAGLLAPVRAGFILTRADLARMARALDLGLRAGERRYALDHLLAQDAPSTLRALADEAERQGARHAARLWSGPGSSFHADRCATSAALLRTLATEGAM